MLDLRIWYYITTRLDFIVQKLKELTLNIHHPNTTIEIASRSLHAENTLVACTARPPPSHEDNQPVDVSAGESKLD